MNKTERYIVYAVLALAVGFILWEQFDKAVNFRVAMESAKVHQDADKKLSEALSARDAQYAKDVATKDAAIADAKKSLVQMAAYASKQVPGATPILVVGAHPETVTVHTGDAIIPAAAGPQYFDAFAAGDKCSSTDLPKCRADVIDWQGKYNEQKKSADDFQTAAKGGSWLHRLKNDAIRVGIGVGIGYALKR